MKTILLAFFCTISFAPAFSQANYTGSLIKGSSTFIRPNEGSAPLTLSSSNVYFNVFTVKITTPGAIRFDVNSVWDNFAILYNGNGFDPQNPAANALLANDDYNAPFPNAGLAYNFTAAGDYFLVICALKPNIDGSFIVQTNPAVVLPLKLLSFTATKTDGNNNIIQWSSEEESNLISYQVQRSTEESKFKDLVNGNIAAKNNTANTAYSFTDVNPVKGFNYYRLKISEKTGLITYSSVAIVKNESAGSTNVKVYPNPSQDYLKIEIKSAQNTKGLIAVINSVGATILNGQYSFNNLGVATVDINQLPAGKYFLKATINKVVTTVSFMKN